MFGSKIKNILSNVKFIATALVLVLGVSTVVFGSNNHTSAFLKSSLKDIGMGVSTDEWQPPSAPQILGYFIDGEEQLKSCETVTSQQVAILSWETPPDQLVLDSYLIGTAENPFQFEVPADQNQVTLEKPSNQWQVIAVDKNGNQSQPSELCTIISDDNQPVISLLQPTSDSFNSTVHIQAEISEPHLKSAQVSILDADQNQVAFGGHINVITPDEGLHSIEFTWDNSQQLSGNYTILIEVTDQADNTTVLDKQITLDTTTPVSALTMNVPLATNSGAILNGSFENGLQNWNTRGFVDIVDSSNEIRPIYGNSQVVLGSSNQSNQVSIISQDLPGSSDIESIGFWYYLHSKQATQSEEGMMVFIGDQLVFEDIVDDQQSGWKYAHLDVSSAQDLDVSIAYYSNADSSTNGELYLDGFTTNNSFKLEDISFQLSAKDVDEADTVVYARYTVNQEEVLLESLNEINFKIDQLPDNQTLEYWAADSFGNLESKKEFIIPVIKESFVEPEVEIEQETEVESEVIKKVSASLDDLGDYHFSLEVSNLNSFDLVDFEIVYSHLVEIDQDQTIQDAITGSVTVKEDEQIVEVKDLFFGTCSSAGLQCTPHLNVTDVTLLLTVTSQNEVATEYVFEYPQQWKTILSEKDESNTQGEND